MTVAVRIYTVVISFLDLWHKEMRIHNVPEDEADIKKCYDGEHGAYLLAEHVHPISSINGSLLGLQLACKSYD